MTAMIFGASILSADIIEVQKGMEIPIELFLKSETVELTDDHTLRALQTFFMKPEENDVKVSSDGENWEDILQYFTGEIRAGITQKEDEIAFELGARLDKR